MSVGKQYCSKLQVLMPIMFQGNNANSFFELGSESLDKYRLRCDHKEGQPDQGDKCHPLKSEQNESSIEQIL